MARAADAQAAMLRRASIQSAGLQPLEADTRAGILPEVGQGRETVLREAAWANRQRELGIWAVSSPLGGSINTNNISFLALPSLTAMDSILTGP